LYTFGRASCSYLRICKQAAKSACQFRKCLLFQHIWPISAYATGLKAERRAAHHQVALAAKQSMLVAFGAFKLH